MKKKIVEKRSVWSVDSKWRLENRREIELSDFQNRFYIIQ